MRTAFSTAPTLFMLGLCHTAVAYSAPQRLTPTNLTSYPFVSIKAQDGSDGCKRFVVTVTPRQGVEPQHFVGDLSVYSNGRLVTRCAVPIRRLAPQSQDVPEPEKQKSGVLTFEVSSANFEKSRFRLTQYHPGEAVWSGEWVGFEEYWFYLKDFAHAK